MGPMSNGLRCRKVQLALHAMDRALYDAGLHARPDEILGKGYAFVCVQKGDIRTTVGIITAVHMTDHAELILEVSTKRFGRGKLVGYSRESGIWYAVVATRKGGKVSQYQGELKLLEGRS